MDSKTFKASSQLNPDEGVWQHYDSSLLDASVIELDENLPIIIFTCSDMQFTMEENEGTKCKGQRFAVHSISHRQTLLGRNLQLSGLVSKCQLVTQIIHRN